MDTYGEYMFKVRSYECGKDGFVTLPSICNYLQEADGKDHITSITKKS